MEDQIADVAQEVRAARERGNDSLEHARKPARATLPPTPGNVFATNALSLLQKREEILIEAIMRAEDLDQLAGEMIACGARVQDFQKKTQDLTSAIADARAVVVVAHAQEPEKGTASPAPEQL